jgi:TRAP transporter TAXI family solute receptor
MLFSAGSIANAASSVPKASIGTHATGSVLMTIHNALSEYIKDKVALSVQPGSVFGNIITTNDHDTDFCTTSATAISSAMEGIRYYKDFGKQENITFVAALHKTYVRFQTINPNIKTPADLKGRSISFGPAGGEAYDYGPMLLALLGLKEGDYTLKTMPWPDAVEAMQNGQLDCILNGAPVPFATVDNLALTEKTAHTVPYPENTAKALCEEWSGWAYEEFPFENDPWAFEKPLYTLYQQMTIIANKDVPDQVVYDYVSTLYSRFEDLGNVASNLKQVGSPDNLMANPSGLTVHPGAARFWKEKGLM